MLKKEEKNNVYISFNDERFKLNRLTVTFVEKLRRRRNTLNALFPMVLLRGNNKYKSMKKINEVLDNMYAAELGIDIDKKGDVQTITFGLSFLNDRYINHNLFKEALEFLYDIIYGPIIYGGGFLKEDIEQEKNNLKQEIESRINDKVRYAIDRCIEVMFENQDYALYEKGSIDDLESITAEELFSHYRDVVLNNPIYVMIYGDYNEEYAISQAQSIFGINERKTVEFDFSIGKIFSQTRYYTEQMEVTQGKLSIGIRTNINVNSDDQFKLTLLNGILSASPKSKLFENVREKASLCYYVFAKVDKFKPVMVISSGIEIDNYDKALNLILKQIEDLNNGQIESLESESAINYYQTAFKAMNDSPKELLNYYLNQALLGTFI